MFDWDRTAELAGRVTLGSGLRPTDMAWMASGDPNALVAEPPAIVRSCGTVQGISGVRSLAEAPHPPVLCRQGDGARRNRRSG